MATFKWVSFSGGDLPDNMVLGGNRSNGEELYVCRAVVSGIVTPGKFWAIGKKAYVPYGGKEVNLTNCEILTCDKPDLVHWVAASNGNIVDGAITAGYEANGEDLYIGRGTQSNELIPGKIFSSHKVCYVSTQRKEWARSDYEVLAVKSFYGLSA